jgi:hypothetical protein
LPSAISALGAAVLARLAKKIAAPQEAVAEDAAFTKALKQFEAARSAVNTYNEAVNKANAEVTAKKAAVAGGDVKKEEAALVRLNAQKKRHDKAVGRSAPSISGSQRPRPRSTSGRPRYGRSWRHTPTR